MLLNNQWLIEEIRNYLERNGNVAYQNLRDAAKAVLSSL